MMKNPRHVLPATAASVALLLLAATPASAKTFTETLTSGKASANVRLRYENVSDDFFAEKAKAMTVRTRLGYETSPFYGFTTLVEFEDTHIVGSMDEFQPPAPPVPAASGEAVIADPEQTELNRIQLRYRGVPKLDMVLGRQRLMFDNQRFIGNVGFRQDEQTFDAFSALYTGIPDWAFTYAYVDRVRGITPVFDANVNDALFNISYNGFVWGKFTAYSYQLSNQVEVQTVLNPGLRYINNDTTGLRLDGAYILPTTASLRTIYRAEYAKQSVDKTATADFDAKYKLGELGLTWTFSGAAYALTPMIGMEILGSDEGLYGLQTPYATKHAFQGWVDQFLVTPDEGLKDQYLSLGFDLNNHKIKTLAVYHDYSSDEKKVSTGKDIDFGSEWNLQVMKTIGANWIVGAKYGKYSAGDDVAIASKREDATKAWAWVELNF